MLPAKTADTCSLYIDYILILYEHSKNPPKFSVDKYVSWSETYCLNGIHALLNFPFCMQQGRAYRTHHPWEFKLLTSFWCLVHRKSTQYQSSYKRTLIIIILLFFLMIIVSWFIMYQVIIGLEHYVLSVLTNNLIHTKLISLTKAVIQKFHS